jgi:hypothetical protein
MDGTVPASAPLGKCAPPTSAKRAIMGHERSSRMKFHVWFDAWGEEVLAVEAADWNPRLAQSLATEGVAVHEVDADSRREAVRKVFPEGRPVLAGSTQPAVAGDDLPGERTVPVRARLH